MSCGGRKLSSRHTGLSLSEVHEEERNGRGGELSEKLMEAESKADRLNRPPVGGAQVAEGGVTERREH